MNALVTYQLDGAVATLTMDDGKANVLSPSMLAELNAALDRALADRAAVVLSGRPGVFCGGFDLAVLMAGGAAAVGMLKAGFEFAERLLSCPRPVVIACNGHALAMGVFLVLSADYRLGVDGAWKIGANEVAIGLTLPRAAIEICRQRLAPAYFSRALNNAEIFAPAEAVAAGFLDRLVAEPELPAEAQATALRLSKLNMTAHTATKLRVRETMLQALRAAIEADDAEFRARMGG